MAFSGLAKVINHVEHKGSDISETILEDIKKVLSGYNFYF